jgi:hypothetical protein
MATLSLLEYPTITEAADAQQRQRRFVFWYEPGTPVELHQKIVTYLVLRDQAERIFEPHERHLLLTIGDAATPTRRQCWALRELSRKAACRDMGGNLDS